MIKQLALGTALGAIVLFLWSFIAWTFIPWPGDPIRSFTNEDAVIAAMKASVPGSGVYLLPKEAKRTPGMTDEQTVHQSEKVPPGVPPMRFDAVRRTWRGKPNSCDRDWHQHAAIRWRGGARTR